MSIGTWEPPRLRLMRQGAPEGCVDLSLGVPNWSLPEVARHAVTEAMATDGPCDYGPNGGTPELVAAIAEHHQVQPERVLVGHGSQGVLYALVAAYCDPGSAALLPDPGFPGYQTLVRGHGAHPVPYRLGAGGQLDAEAFSQTLHTAREQGPVSIAIINHPGNPTGGGADPAALRRVAAECHAAGVLLISDEVYQELHLGPRPTSLREVTDTGVVVSSVSKAWAAPGLRIGWGLADPETLAPARAVHAAMTTAPARPSQVAATALLTASETVLGESWKQLVRRWAVAQTAPEAVRATTSPAGGFYHWLRLPEWATADPEAFCLRVRDESRVIVVPGTFFGEAGAEHVRISCGATPSALREGLERLAPWWERAPATQAISA